MPMQSRGSTEVQTPSTIVRTAVKSLVLICCNHLLPDATSKLYILASLFHLPLVQLMLALCQTNIPISGKLSEMPFGGADLSG